MKKIDNSKSIKWKIKDLFYCKYAALREAVLDLRLVLFYRFVNFGHAAYICNLR